MTPVLVRPVSGGTLVGHSVARRPFPSCSDSTITDCRWLHIPQTGYSHRIAPDYLTASVRSDAAYARLRAAMLFCNRSHLQLHASGTSGYGRMATEERREATCLWPMRGDVHAPRINERVRADVLAPKQDTMRPTYPQRASERPECTFETLPGTLESHHVPRITVTDKSHYAYSPGYPRPTLSKGRMLPPGC